MRRCIAYSSRRGTKAPKMGRKRRDRFSPQAARRCSPSEPRGDGMSHSLVVLPDNSVKPILDAINGAKKPLRIKMFVFSDPSLLKAVIAAHRLDLTDKGLLDELKHHKIDEESELRSVWAKSSLISVVILSIMTISVLCCALGRESPLAPVIL